MKEYRRLTIICLNCGEPKVVPAIRVESGGGKYCSTKCFCEYQSNLKRNDVLEHGLDRIYKAIKGEYPRYKVRAIVKEISNKLKI